jgi:tetratricopeptide (TPR) repeat protein
MPQAIRILQKLGLLAEAEENYAEARTCLQQALAIFTEFGDQHYVAMVQQICDRLPS